MALILHARTADGVFAVDVEEDAVVGLAVTAVPLRALDVGLPRVVSADAAGSTVVALVDRRPPLLVSYDAGATWQEAGGGLPAGIAVAIHPDDPDLVAFAARNRLFVSRDGGRFWRALTPELPEIEAVGWE